MHTHFEIGASVQIGDNVQGTVAASVAAVSIDALDQAGQSPKYSLIQVVKRGGTGDVTLPAPVKVIATCLGRRVVLGTLNAGGAIVVGDNGGYQELLQGVGLCSALVLLPASALLGASTPAYDAFVVAIWGSP